MHRLKPSTTNPDLKTAWRALTATPATSLLLAAITIAFVAEVMTGALQSLEGMRSIGAITDDAYRGKETHRLLTGMFLHANLVHLAGNAWVLMQLGGLFEQMFGTRRFLFVWFGSGVIASFVSSVYLAPDRLSVGASGAISGLIGAFIFSLGRSVYWRTHPITTGLRAQIVFSGIVMIAIGFRTPYTDNAAHVGGFCAGLIFGLLSFDLRTADVVHGQPQS